MAGLFELIFKTGTKIEKRLIMGLGTRTQFYLFTLSINCSAKPDHRCEVSHLVTSVGTNFFDSSFFLRKIGVKPHVT